MSEAEALTENLETALRSLKAAEVAATRLLNGETAAWTNGGTRVLSGSVRRHLQHERAFLQKHIEHVEFFLKMAQDLVAPALGDGARQPAAWVS